MFAFKNCFYILLIIGQGTLKSHGLGTKESDTSLQFLKEKLDWLEARMEKTETKMRDLEDEGGEAELDRSSPLERQSVDTGFTPVVFHAERTSTISSGSTIYFNRVATNVGNAFSGSFFRAPYDGVYYFKFTGFSNFAQVRIQSSSTPSNVYAYAYQSGAYGTFGTQTIRNMKRGQYVYVRRLTGTIISYTSSVYTSFSGFRLS